MDRRALLRWAGSICSTYLAIKTGEEDLWVALDRIQDPGNLGTIVRTCDATGCAGVILLDNCTDPYDPTALRASMGAIYNIRLVKASLAEFSAWQNDTNIPVIGTSDRAETYFRAVEYPASMVVLMGSEKLGLTAGSPQALQPGCQHPHVRNK